MNTASNCPCGPPAFPWTVANRPGLGSISYRVGDFAAFRQALLQPRDGENELPSWQADAQQDLAVQMIEWWAYLADILSFYNERIANQAYLRTADLPESVNRLARALGYRPKPGIGAVGTLAALLAKPLPLSLPQGLQFQSKPGPGQTPQIFELDADTTLNPPDAVPVDPAPDPGLLHTDASGRACVLLAGAVASVKPGDELLLLARGGQSWAWVTVAAATPQKDARGKPNTQIAFASAPALPTDAKVDDYRLLRSNRYARAWQYQTGGDFAAIDAANGAIHLDSIVRDIKTGDPLLFTVDSTAAAASSGVAAPGIPFPDINLFGINLADLPASPGALAADLFVPDLIFVLPPPSSPQLAFATSYTESIWYANPDAPALDPNLAPAKQPNPPPPIPITHSVIGFSPALTGVWELYKSQALLRYGWQEVGPLLATPASGLDAGSPSLSASPPATLPPGSNVKVMVEDANGFGVSAYASVTGSPPTLKLSGLLPDPPPGLTPPLRMLYGLLPVSRGKTVAGEILGSGDATVAGQEFLLKNAPLTYLPGASPGLGQNYRSTLTVRVDGIAWQEVPNFYGQPADAKVFATFEDENNQTHVMFGDGINGARLSSGVDNVVASYRVGSGAQSPPAGSLNVILQPRPNLKAVRNPVAVSGGGDPDPPGQIRRYAPQSVLAFGRAISADDYETVAAQATGVARARSYWAWDPGQQRALTTVYVGDDASAVASAQAALNLARDPNRPVAVKLATPVPVRLSLSLLVDPKYEAAAVLAQVQAALLDPQDGLFGLSLRIGQTLYDSQIHQACLSVPGAVAVRGLRFDSGQFVPLARRLRIFPRPSGLFPAATETHSPGVGGFFQLSADRLEITPEAAHAQ